MLYIIIYGIKAETLPPAKVNILTLTYFIHLESMYNVDFNKFEYQINVNFFYLFLFDNYCTHYNCDSYLP